MQSVVFDMPVKGCKTRDNVTVEIDVALVFRIMGDKNKVRAASFFFFDFFFYRSRAPPQTLARLTVMAQSVVLLLVDFGAYRIAGFYRKHSMCFIKCPSRGWVHVA